MKKMVIVPALLLGLLFNSCEDDIINLDPYNSVSEETAFTTPSLIELTVMGMYQAAQRGDYNENWRGYPFGAAFVQQGDNRGEDVVNIYTFYRLTYTNTYNTTTANNVWYWSDSYRLINRCNIVIEGVGKAAEEGIITEEVAGEYEAEARMMRAMAHHELLVHFARPYEHTSDASHPGVPYREIAYTSPSAVEEGIAQGRNTVAECYSKILADLDFAEANLPTKAERSGNFKIVRLNKEAAIAWKTRIYLHMWNMDKVIEEGEKLKSIEVYQLTSEPSEPFTSNYSNSESIFSMENTATNNPGVNAALASQYKRRLLVCISPIIWKNPYWLADDKRRDETTMVYDYQGVKFTWKYKDEVSYTDASPVIRYAEIILNLAEAYARRNNSGDFDKALVYLNMVRNRALADPAEQAYTPDTFMDNVDLLEAILAERRIEFVMEGRRWPDIHRLQQCPYLPVNGIPAKLANASPSAESFELGTPYNGPYGVDAIPYDDYRFLWPIPQVEVDANPTLADQQNPGW